MWSTYLSHVISTSHDGRSNIYRSTYGPLNFTPDFSFSFFYFFKSDSVSYFFDELDRISRIDYVPSNKDILHCRKATKGVFEFTIRIQVSVSGVMSDKLVINQ